MKVRDKTTFQSQGLYNLTAQIQENNLLNRGLLDLGGIAVPQIIMSNNEDEKVERGVLQSLYFVSSFMAPYVLLPFFNKTFLARNGVVKNFSNNERKIIEVSKKYLTKDVDFMVKGIRKTAQNLVQEAEKKGKKIAVKEDFENILNRFSDKEELKNKLLKTHEHILFADFLCTSLMWCATPWVSMEVTKLRTNRSGFSATYSMIDEKQSRLNAKKHEQEKKKKLLISAIIGVIPAVVFPKLVTKGFKDKSGILNGIVKKYSESFNYTKGIFPSKSIIAAIWLLSDYPSQVISSRDKYERRDRAIRGAGTFVAFFGGDYILNNIFGRLADRILKTEIMDRSNLKNDSGFFKKLLMQPKSFSEIEDLKNVTPTILKKTKGIGAGLYWLTLVANMAILGFGLPVILNAMLKKSIKKDTSERNAVSVN